MTASIGQPIQRTESIAKVTGRARYAAEQPPAVGQLYAWYVPATVPAGTVERVELDDDPTVHAVVWHGNAEKLGEVEDAELHVLQSNTVAYRGQIVAVVVADTLQDARAAAARVRVQYTDVRSPDNTLTVEHGSLYAPESVNAGFPTDVTIGDPDAALKTAEHVVDNWYSTAPMHNSPMEPHATTAQWADGVLTLWDSTQAPSGVQGDLATAFDLEPENVRVVAENVGGGFGAKGSTRPNAILAAMAARATGRTVKLVLPREALFDVVGYRTPTLNHVRLGADSTGALQAIAHDSFQQTSTIFEFCEQTAESTRHIYAAPNRRTTHRLAKLDVGTPRWMRAPGEAPGMFAVETAIDELAAVTGVDPIELRVRNEPDVDPASGNPFSSRSVVQCLREGAEKFGWDRRDPTPGQRREGNTLVGMGVATASYPVLISPSTASARVESDGTITVSVAASDIGTGARTVLRQIAADALEVDADSVTVELGDSALPTAPGAGGSSGTSSWGWAVTKVCHSLKSQGSYEPGNSAEADTTDDVEGQKELARMAFGAQFAEVAVDIDTGEVRVRRMLGVFGIGAVMNPRLARSQLIGGMTFGLGMALMENGITDHEFGGFANHDLAEYHIPACADVTDLEAVWVEEVDTELAPMGGKGIGEIGAVGSSAAIGNAVYNATGVRVRDLPITLDKVLPHL
ncbi:xanthine dehydrogenase family protein molybdopterin-binding subunit [Rhodococcus sp. IEGM 1401]|uniref:xanthine dehydrogenase family protein molybdopterin-binding subunit n=1 Tax=unclassified Rhodococcus (in: high G+C Gram-positive bacteria) TaxID=192944 RepID=UPI0022B50205|nr:MULTISPECIES: xanthine dehydrogenase family protein molybdopterin-binding subunit [unclassified Rhodococcus (in: high G+C Gram-positive bacteria)]MCZ4563273.1 xanthine dehydrogenase family protein molybdopterin-binding subunit [Rhodococcus sp. IEGM 1401]MDI9923355.1 xanthine dehydrogenase family protein molybdopterin-binding subunit [Rhodococcus sp. IEGM 1372]MDV8035885.1 xanthine dehydrogenase family protein molybdopterin-binding subunit [Rhodococcus sp. IEGM 1414]